MNYTKPIGRIITDYRSYCKEVAVTFFPKDQTKNTQIELTRILTKEMELDAIKSILFETMQELLDGLFNSSVAIVKNDENSMQVVLFVTKEQFYKKPEAANTQEEASNESQAL